MALSINSITANDRITGQTKTFTIGENNVKEIYMVIKVTKYAEEFDIEQTIKLDDRSLLETGEAININTSRNSLTALSPTRYRSLQEIGPPVKIVTEKELYRIFAVVKDEVKEFVEEAMSLYNETLDEVDGDIELAREFLAEFEIDPELLEVISSPEVVSYTSRKFPLKFFVRSWNYKLLWLIPMDLHLIGVDSPARIYFFGGDKFGRDVLSRILFGSRISMSIGLLGILITFTLGLFIGGVAGYYGGWADETLMRITEILMSIPGFYLLISTLDVCIDRSHFEFHWLAGHVQGYKRYGIVPQRQGICASRDSHGVSCTPYYLATYHSKYSYLYYRLCNLIDSRVHPWRSRVKLSRPWYHRAFSKLGVDAQPGTKHKIDDRSSLALDTGGIYFHSSYGIQPSW